MSARTDLLSEGVHVLPVIRLGDGALLVVVANADGEALSEPEWMPLSADMSDVVDRLITVLEKWRAKRPSAREPIQRNESEAAKLVG